LLPRPSISTFGLSGVVNWLPPKVKSLGTPLTQPVINQWQRHSM